MKFIDIKFISLRFIIINLTYLLIYENYDENIGFTKLIKVLKPIIFFIVDFKYVFVLVTSYRKKKKKKFKTVLITSNLILLKQMTLMKITQL